MTLLLVDEIGIDFSKTVEEMTEDSSLYLLLKSNEVNRSLNIERLMNILDG